MPVHLNTLLKEAGLELGDIRLLRHADPTARKGRTPYDLWRDDRQAFDLYQSIQTIQNRAAFGEANYWASFAASAEGDTVFVGIYEAKFKGLLEHEVQLPHKDGVAKAGTVHQYDLSITQILNDLAGRMRIDWGAGTRTWIQRADLQNKEILEVTKAKADPPFPGYNEFMEPLSRIEALPKGWRDALRSSRGVYLLTCPRTKEQYVGKADGADGFLSRWLFYAESGHGGNVGLKSREPSDYQVSILEVAGSAASPDDILRMESRWKDKLRSREMGLNRN
jgi:hypothetical protein